MVARRSPASGSPGNDRSDAGSPAAPAAPVIARRAAGELVSLATAGSPADSPTAMRCGRAATTDRQTTAPCRSRFRQAASATAAAGMAAVVIGSCIAIACGIAHSRVRLTSRRARHHLHQRQMPGQWHCAMSGRSGVACGRKCLACAAYAAIDAGPPRARWPQRWDYSRTASVYTNRPRGLSSATWHASLRHSRRRPATHDLP